MMLVQHLVQPPEPPRSQSPIPPPVSNPTTTASLNMIPTAATATTTAKGTTSAPSPSPLELTRTQWESSKPPSSRQTNPESQPKFILGPATLEDAAQIAQLGGGTFAATFGFSMPAVDMDAYLEEAYSLEAIIADICSPEKHFLVATSTSARPETETETEPDRAGGRNLIGFAQLTENTTEPCLSHYRKAEMVELQRLYVSREAQGLGIGKTLMKEIESKARSMGYKYMWLGAWEGNFIAQRVYESMGFERVGDHEFRMGRCIQTDWIMVKEL